LLLLLLLLWRFKDVGKRCHLSSLSFGTHPDRSFTGMVSTSLVGTGVLAKENHAAEDGRMLIKVSFNGSSLSPREVSISDGRTTTSRTRTCSVANNDGFFFAAITSSTVRAAALVIGRAVVSRSGWGHNETLVGRIAADGKGYITICSQFSAEACHQQVVASRDIHCVGG